MYVVLVATYLLVKSFNSIVDHPHHSKIFKEARSRIAFNSIVDHQNEIVEFLKLKAFAESFNSIVDHQEWLALSPRGPKLNLSIL